MAMALLRRVSLPLFILLLPLLVPVAALAQTTVRGNIFGTSNDITLGSTFVCTGTPTCTGTIQIDITSTKCSSHVTLGQDIVFTGLNVATPGAIQGTITMKFDFGIRAGAGGACVIDLESTPLLGLYTGTWNGSQGTLSIELPDPSAVPPSTDRFSGNFIVETTPPVFPVKVSGSIDAVSANVQAEIQFRPQDVGTTQSVYVFALAPASVVRPLAGVDLEPMRIQAKGAKAGEVACVLAQLTSGGQLQQVSASQMQAFVTGTLSSQGLAITVLNGVPTVQIAGATFYVGYGTSASSMITSGVNRAVATAPGSTQCKPERPQTGWWWSPAEGGRGYSLEVRGNNMFFASYLYDVSGRSTWYAAVMPVSLEGSYYTGTLFNKSGGQMLEGAYRAPGAAVTAGAMVLAFNDASHGTLVWPGGTVPIERFNIVANGAAALPRANQPESGWWWNPAEDGRGFYIEWQDGNAFIAGYMYDAAGNPLWYASQAATPDARAFQGAWSQYSGGQTLTGTYRPPIVSNASVAPVTITFTGADAGMLTLPGGRTTAITRFRF
ncbi:MAG TPA: hypothetical protein VM122_13030 [Usitatibacter sp.]|nr:hypothetical protein [Usitatibacter sp.]